MRQARQWKDNALAVRVSAAVALASGSLIAVATPAAAQPAVVCGTAACNSAQQSQLVSLLSPFTTLAATPAFAADFQIQGNIYQNAPYGQRVQAAQNAILANAPTLIWAANNNPSPLAANVLGRPGQQQRDE